MRSYYTGDQVRAAEARLFTEVPAGVPMQRAAYGLATVVVGELRARTGGVAGRKVTLLVGSGDNGGDVLWAGAMLRHRGIAVDAILFSPDRAHAEGLAALRRRGGRVVADVQQPDLVLDGIVGLSGRGPLRPEAAEVVAAVTVPIVSADLPSGVDPDTGAVSGPAVRADVTVCFGALKPAHALAAARCGRIELVPIGLRLDGPHLESLDPADVGALWPVPGPDDDKYSQGVVGVAAGSTTFPGAAMLCSAAAVAATSGMVRYVGSATEAVLAKCPEVVATRSIDEVGQVQAWVVGPGSGTDDAARDTVRTVLNTDLPVLVDADALTMIATDPDLVRGRVAPTLLTPHAGEFARLTGRNVGPDRTADVRALAADWGVTVLLKGRATVIADPDSSVLVNDAAGSWAATAGSGDVLSGVIGALMASGLMPITAAAAGAKVHALAANLAAHVHGLPESGTAPISASPLLSQVGAAIAVLRAHALPDRSR